MMDGTKGNTRTREPKTNRVNTWEPKNKPQRENTNPRVQMDGPETVQNEARVASTWTLSESGGQEEKRPQGRLWQQVERPLGRLKASSEGGSCNR